MTSPQDDDPIGLRERQHGLFPHHGGGWSAGWAADAVAAAPFRRAWSGDRLLSLTGRPYDTLEEVIGLRGRGQGSRSDFGVMDDELTLAAHPHGADPAELWLQLAAIPAGGPDRSSLRAGEGTAAGSRLLRGQLLRGAVAG